MPTEEQKIEMDAVFNEPLSDRSTYMIPNTLLETLNKNSS